MRFRYSLHTLTLVRLACALFFIFLPFYSLVFGTDTAKAQTPECPWYIGCDNQCTALHEFCTAVPTYEPLFKTPTPLPPESYTCPTGLPIGWGTVTPGVMWSANCGNCLLTLTPHPTNTPGSYELTQTAVFTGTPGVTLTPTSTVTPTPASCTPGANTYWWDTVNPNKSATKPAQYVGEFRIGWSRYSPSDLTSIGAVVAKVNMQGSTNNEWGRSWIGVNGGTNQVLWQAQTNFDKTLFYMPTVTPPGWNYTQLRNFILAKYPDAVDSGYKNWVAGAIDLDAGYGAGTATNNTFTVTVTVLDWVHYSPAPCPTPTPGTPTPTPGASACNDLGDEGTTDSIGELPYIGIGASVCTGIPEFTIDLSVLNWLPGLEDIDVITFPGLSVCARPISFGDLKLFGLVIDLDIMAAVMAGVVLIRIIIRS